MRLKKLIVLQLYLCMNDDDAVSPGSVRRFALDPAWSETGDRYMLKLFRDYLFHQVDDSGAPWIDMAHIVQCMNKVSSEGAGKPRLEVAPSQSRFWSSGLKTRTKPNLPVVIFDFTVMFRCNFIQLTLPFSKLALS